MDLDRPRRIERPAFGAPRTACAILVAAVAAVASVQAADAPPDADIAGRGCVRASARERVWYESAATRAGRIRFNALGAERIREAAAARGNRTADAGAGPEIVPFGEEIEDGSGGTTVDAIGPTRTCDAAMLPESVDNSALKAFPPIRSQGSVGSCSSFSVTYYQFTHQVALVRGWDAKNGGDHLRFAPNWTYNFLNGGEDTGTSTDGTMQILAQHGACTWQEMPYSTSATGYRRWVHDNPQAWRDAIRRRLGKFGDVRDIDSEPGLSMVRQLLVNGYVLGCSSDFEWDRAAIGDDPATKSDDAFVGQSIARYAKAGGSGHAVTVVGYHDGLWCDINANGRVDAGEKGALKIANSWGAGDWNGGYRWIAYDALRKASAVEGAPTANRDAAFWGNAVRWMSPRPDYVPRWVGVFGVRHPSRRQMSLRIGKADCGASQPSTSWFPSVLHFSGGDYRFDGTTAGDPLGTFAFDMEWVCPDAGAPKRYFLTLQDATSGDAAGALVSFRLEDGWGNPVAAADGLPVIADGGTVHAWVDYVCPVANACTVEVATADANAFEHGLDPGMFRIARSGDASAAIVVNLGYAGTASDSDYEMAPAAVVFAAGQTNLDLAVTPLDDDAIESPETVDIRIEPGAGYVAGAKSYATLTIISDDLVDIIAPSQIYVEEGGSARLPVRLTAPPAAPLQVEVSVEPASSGDIAIPDGAATLTFTAADWSEYRFVTLTCARDADARHLSDCVWLRAAGLPQKRVYAYELDVDAPEVLAVAEPACLDVPEGGLAEFRIRLNKEPTNDTTVLVARDWGSADISVSGSGRHVFGPTNWSVWQTVVIAAAEEPGIEPGSARIRAAVDDLKGGGEDGRSTIAAVGSGPVGSHALVYPYASVDVYELENDIQAVTIHAAGDAAEPASDGGFLFSRAGRTNDSLTVGFAVGGTAAAGSDYAALGGAIVFAPGVVTNLLRLRVLDDGANEPAETVVVTLQPTNTCMAPIPSATVRIVDDENVAPAARGATLRTAEDTALSIGLGGYVENPEPADALTYVLASLPRHGRLTGGVPDVRYTPDADWHGADDFAWRVSDGQRESSNVVLAIAVDAVNDPPVCTLADPNADHDVFHSDAALSLRATATDIEGNDSVSNVTFLSDGVPVGVDTNDGDTAYETQSAAPAVGAHTIAARARDRDGSEGLSASVAVRVVDRPVAPWLGVDLGAPGRPGVSGRDGGTLVVAGGGGDIWGNADAGHFICVPAAGDGHIVIRLRSHEKTNNDAKVGLMVRASLAADAPNVFVKLKADRYRARLQWRLAAGGATEQGAESGDLALPQWLKLARSNGTIAAYRSADGIDWTVVGAQTLDLPDMFYVGVAATARDNARLCTATADSLDVAFAPRVLIDRAEVVVPEGGTGGFRVRLDQIPLAAVTAAVGRVSGDEDLSALPGPPLSFDAANWSTWQDRTLAAAADADDREDTAVFEVGGVGLRPATLTAREFDTDRNHAPVVEIVEPRTNAAAVAAGVGLLLAARGSDPDGDALTIAWDAQGPSGATWDSAGNWATGVRFGTNGEFGVRAVVSDGALTNAATLRIQVLPSLAAATGLLVNAGPFVDAGADVTDAEPAVPLALAGIVRDDGRPAPPGVVTARWSVLGGADGVRFDDPAAANTAVTFAESGSYALRLRADDGQVATFDDLAVTVRFTGPAVWVEQTGGGTAVVEGGAADLLTLRLNTQPTQDVTVALTADAQLALGASELVFTGLNWSDAQSLAVAAADDETVEGIHTGCVSFAVASGDTNYNGLAVAGVAVAVTDNDAYGFVGFSAATALVVEAGGSVTVRLERVGGEIGAVSATYETVDGSAAARGDYAACTGTLVWAHHDCAMREIVVPVLDDAEREDDETFSVRLTHIGGGAAASAVAEVVVTVRDDEFAPAVNNGAGATNIGPLTAELRGELEWEGHQATEVTVFWGQSDGGTNAAGWAHARDVGAVAPGLFAVSVDGLAPNTPYFYRCRASNATTSTWAAASAAFRTPASIFDDWRFRMRIAFRGYDGSEALTDVPLLVALSTNVPGFRYGNFASSRGADLRFTDATGARALDHEVEQWDPAGVSAVWVKVPDLRGTNTAIFAFWGNADAAGAPPCASNGAVWSADYRGVWHLSETGQAVRADATAFRNHAVARDFAGDEAIAGLAGGAQRLDAGPDCLDCGPDGSLRLAQFTLSFWTRAERAPALGYSQIVSGGPVERNYAFSWDHAPGFMQSLGFVSAGGAWSVCAATNALGGGRWYHIAGTYDGTNMAVYIDGRLSQSVPGPPPVLKPGPTCIGRGAQPGEAEYAGAVDEVRIAARARPADWIRATWLNMASNAGFVAFGPVERLHANAPPTAGDDGAVTDEDTPVRIAVLANDGDADGDALRVISLEQASNGAVADVGAALQYTPAADFNGIDGFSYVVGDGVAGAATGRVTVTVRPVNDVPIALNDTAWAIEDGSVEIDVLANDGDVDGDNVRVSALTRPGNGAAVISSDRARIVYSPVRDFCGTNDFGYTVEDGHGGRASATVTVIVAPVNDPPRASIVWPTNNAVCVAGANVVITGACEDVEGGCTQLVVVADGNLLGSCFLRPRTVVWNDVPAGLHRLVAIAYDDGGLSGTSAAVTIVADADCDGDGAPDIADLDDDGDGVPDADEYVAGTDPANARSLLCLSGVPSTGSLAQAFWFHGVSGRLYHVEWTPALAPPVVWRGLVGYTNLPGSGTSVRVPDGGASGYYRVKARLPP